MGVTAVIIAGPGETGGVLMITPHGNSGVLSTSVNNKSSQQLENASIRLTPSRENLVLFPPSVDFLADLSFFYNDVIPQYIAFLSLTLALFPMMFNGLPVFSFEVLSQL
jgi:hypothetical protein